MDRAIPLQLRVHRARQAGARVFKLCRYRVERGRRKKHKSSPSNSASSNSRPAVSSSIGRTNGNAKKSGLIKRATTDKRTKLTLALEVGQLQYADLRPQPLLEKTKIFGPEPNDQRFVRERHALRDHALGRGGVSRPVAAPPGLDGESQHQEGALGEVPHPFAQQVGCANARDGGELHTQRLDLRGIETVRVERIARAHAATLGLRSPQHLEALHPKLVPALRFVASSMSVVIVAQQLGAG